MDTRVASLDAFAARLLAALGRRPDRALARRMAARGREAEAFTHDGPAKDDARVVFWQVAPAALAAPGLDPSTAADRMVAAIEASPHAADFTATVLAERYFREVTEAMIEPLREECG
jgi:hypothetical protein